MDGVGAVYGLDCGGAPGRNRGAGVVLGFDKHRERRRVLTVNPASGNSPSDVAVLANGKGLAPGEYKGYLSITAAEVVNSPVRVEVMLTVAGPQLVASPVAISATQQLGTGAPAITRLVTVSVPFPKWRSTSPRRSTPAPPSGPR